jgi:serine/threonine protein kinase
LEDGPAAESFIGTLAYMSPERVRGVTEYSYEADMWSLGITMITVMTRRIPFPTSKGSWQLMKAILEGPQPTITTKEVSSEMHDFIHECLNQPLRDKSSAQKLLNHPFLSLARNRGILPLHKPPVLTQHGKLMPFDLPSDKAIDRIVELGISWQLERMEDEYNLSIDKSSHQKEPLVKHFSRFSKLHIESLATQMGAETSILEEKYVYVQFLKSAFLLQY